MYTALTNLRRQHCHFRSVLSKYTVSDNSQHS